jgi:hypothetical protein
VTTTTPISVADSSAALTSSWPISSSTSGGYTLELKSVTGGSMVLVYVQPSTPAGSTWFSPSATQPANPQSEDTTMAQRPRPSSHMQGLEQTLGDQIVQVNALLASLVQAREQIRRTRNTVQQRNTTINQLRGEIDELRLALGAKPAIDKGKLRSVPRLVLTEDLLFQRGHACNTRRMALLLLHRAGYGAPGSSREVPQIEVTVESLAYAFSNDSFRMTYGPLAWLERIAPKLRKRWDKWAKLTGKPFVANDYRINAGVDWLYLNLLHLTIENADDTGLADGTRYIPTEVTEVTATV